jgi:hypothetical protein
VWETQRTRHNVNGTVASGVHHDAIPGGIARVAQSFEEPSTVSSSGMAHSYHAPLEQRFGRPRSTCRIARHDHIRVYSSKSCSSQDMVLSEEVKIGLGSIRVYHERYLRDYLHQSRRSCILIWIVVLADGSWHSYEVVDSALCSRTRT